jgi:DNA-binding NtrC family response regulator
MSGRLISKDRYGGRTGDVIMPNILVLGEQSQFRTLLSESLWFDGHRVEIVADVAMLREHLGNTQPDLVLLDANTDGFGAMRLYQDLKQKFPDLAVMVYQCRNYGDVNRIKGAVDDALENNTAPQPDNSLGSKGTVV